MPMKIPYRKLGYAYDFLNYVYITVFIIFGILGLVYQELLFLMVLVIILFIVQITDLWIIDGKMEIIQKGDQYLLKDYHASHCKVQKIRKIYCSWHYEFLEMSDGLSDSGGSTHTTFTNLMLTIELVNGQKIAFIQYLWPWQVEPFGWPYMVFDQNQYDRVLTTKINLGQLEKTIN